MREGASSSPACDPRALTSAAVSSHPRRMSLEATRRPTGDAEARQTEVDPGATLPRHALTRVSISGFRARFFTFSGLACLIRESFYKGRILRPRLSDSRVRLYGIDPISVNIRFCGLDRSDSVASGFLFSCRARCLQSRVRI